MQVLPLLLLKYCEAREYQFQLVLNHCEYITSMSSDCVYMYLSGGSHAPVRRLCLCLHVLSMLTQEYQRWYATVSFV